MRIRWLLLIAFVLSPTRVGTAAELNGNSTIGDWMEAPAEERRAFSMSMVRLVLKNSPYPYKGRYNTDQLASYVATCLNAAGSARNGAMEIVPRSGNRRPSATQEVATAIPICIQFSERD